MITTKDDVVLIRIKAVPGASRDAIAGPLADRLKLRVAAPPEGGKANRAICKLLARALEVRPGDVEIRAGHASPDKLVAIRTIDEATARRRLGL